MDGITYRKGERKDLPRVEELFKEMLRAIYDREDVKGYDEGYLDKFVNGGEDLIALAEKDGEIIGYLSVEVHREDEDFIYLDDFSVSGGYRGNGIGSELLDIAEDFAKEKNIKSIYLHVERENEGALRLYERRGYVIAAEEGNRYRMLRNL